MRQYLYIEQLCELVPWSPSAIRRKMVRGVFKQGVHYFKPHGPRSRPIFSWVAVQALIKGDYTGAEATGETIPLANGAVVNLDEAAAKIRAMLD